MEIRELDTSALSDIIQQERKYLREPRLCLKSAEEDIIKCLKSACSVGAFEDNQLVAYCLAYHNEYGLGIIEKCFTNPSFRGRGLQFDLLRRGVRNLDKRGVRNVLTMVSPHNHASYKNFRRCGFGVSCGMFCEGQERIFLTLVL